MHKINGNDIPVYTFTTHIFKHRHPRLDWGSQNHCVISRSIIDTKVTKYTV